MTTTKLPSPVDLSEHGIDPAGRVYRNPSTALLYTHALARGDGRLAEGGPLVVDTGKFTGRSPKDKFLVDEPSSTRPHLVGRGEPEARARRTSTACARRSIAISAAADALFVIDAWAGADPAHRIGVRVVTAHPYHALFAKTMFIDPTDDELASFRPQALVLHAPDLEADPDEDGTRTSTAIVLHPGADRAARPRHLLRRRDQEVDLHGDERPASARGRVPDALLGERRRAGDVAMFFGLSGTGKTTLSADPERHLIGDDEHGWGDNGVFNIEGGCYAKTIRLSPVAEPEIYATTHTFGTILENVIVDEQGVVDLDDDSKTENTRAAYKLEQIGNALPAKRAGHPRAVVFLTADAFGDPAADRAPVARRRRSTTSSPASPRSSPAPRSASPSRSRPSRPASASRSCRSRRRSTRGMLGEKLDRHGSTVWLVNTGWTGGPFGEGERMPIQATRTMLRAALSRRARRRRVPHRRAFGFDVPVHVRGRRRIAARSALDLARPRARTTRKARELATLFAENFAKRFADVGASIRAAGPTL